LPAKSECINGYVELICRRKVMHGIRFTLAERQAWNPSVKMFFQSNAWMDIKVMLESATRFNNHICQRWGKGTKVLLTCDNLSAHVNPDTKAATSVASLVKGPHHNNSRRLLLPAPDATRK